MSNDQNRQDMGGQIKTALADALSTGDFSNLNNLVSQTVTDALNDAGKNLAEGFSEQNKTSTSNRYTQEQQRIIREQQKLREAQAQLRKQHNELNHQKRQWEQQRREQMFQQQKLQQEQAIQRSQAAKQAGQMGQSHRQPPKASQKSAPAQTTALVPVKFMEVGSVSGVLYQVFGGIGLGLSSLLGVFRLFGALLFATGTPVGWAVNIAAFVASLGMIQSGSNKRDRLKRAKRYIQLCGNKMYGQIESLARDTGKSARYVARDIRKMLNLGMFPEGHLDDQKTCFMLNDTVHRQYLETKENHLLLEQKDLAAENAQNKNASPAVSPEEAELNTMIAEGMDCIRRLRELNDCIPGEVISEKLYRLEGLLKDIFNGVREHPEQMHRMHSMMDYYLPTTLKLVEAYKDFDKVNSPGEEITAAKEEIERTMDIINQAFAELLDKLFQDAVFDATTDAQVLKTMLAKGGLTENTQFQQNTNSGGEENNEQ